MSSFSQPQKQQLCHPQDVQGAAGALTELSIERSSSPASSHAILERVTSACRHAAMTTVGMLAASGFFGPSQRSANAQAAEITGAVVITNVEYDPSIPPEFANFAKLQRDSTLEFVFSFDPQTSITEFSSAEREVHGVDPFASFISSPQNGISQAYFDSLSIDIINDTASSPGLSDSLTVRGSISELNLNFEFVLGVNFDNSGSIDSTLASTDLSDGLVAVRDQTFANEFFTAEDGFFQYIVDGQYLGFDVFYEPIQVLNAGDYNLDFIVNAADYTVWRDNLGSREDLRADGNLDGVVDVDDYLVWKENFGNVYSFPEFGAASSNQGVPEPGTLRLIACMAAAGAGAIRVRQVRGAQS